MEDIVQKMPVDTFYITPNELGNILDGLSKGNT